VDLLPPILYGIPKIHKPGTPIRPAINSSVSNFASKLTPRDVKGKTSESQNKTMK
jgi:hypothetical protein